MNKHNTSQLTRSKSGAVAGVCKGIAQHYNFNTFWVRMATIVLTFLFFPLPIFIYIGAALLMKPEPRFSMENDNEVEFFNSTSTSRSMALSRLKDQCDRIDRRISRMEDAVTSREYKWKQFLD